MTTDAWYSTPSLFPGSKLGSVARVEVTRNDDGRVVVGVAKRAAYPHEAVIPADEVPELIAFLRAVLPEVIEIPVTDLPDVSPDRVSMDDETLHRRVREYLAVLRARDRQRQQAARDSEVEARAGEWTEWFREHSIAENLASEEVFEASWTLAEQGVPLPDGAP